MTAAQARGIDSDTIGVLFVFAARALLGLPVGIILARMLTAEGYGIYGFSMAIASILAIPATLGFRTLLVREVSACAATENWAALRGLVRRAIQIVSVTSIIVAFVAAGVILTIRNQDSVILITVLTGVLIIPIRALINTIQGALQGLRKIIVSQATEHILQPFCFLALLLGLWLVTAEYSPPTAVALSGVSFVAVLVVAIALLRHHYPASASAAQPVYSTKIWLKSSSRFMVMSSIGIFQNEIDVLMIAPILDVEQAGIYRASARLTALIPIGLMAITVPFMPKIAATYASHKQKIFQHDTRIVARFGTLFAIVTGTILIILGPFFLNLFGPEFVRGYLVIIVLSIGQIIFCTLGPAVALMGMAGKEAYILKIQTAGVLLNVVLNLALIPHYGILGAAVATAVSLVIWKIMLVIVAMKVLRINSTVLAFVSK